jgi:hypothetical protein
MAPPSGKGTGKGSKDDRVGGGVVCAHCKKAGELGTMKFCGRCHRVYYCSVECQRMHWRRGGHKAVCRKEGGGVAVAAGPGGVDAVLQNPCPICLDNEDNVGDSGMCFSCGQMFCGQCKESAGFQSIVSCPTCRMPTRVSPAEDARRVVQLLARPDGRPTRAAQYTLGTYYMTGHGVAQDDAEAARLFRVAADKGGVLAQQNLAVFYMVGRGLAQDDAEAARLCRLAADQGCAPAQYNLAILTRDGRGGIARDRGEVARLYRLAADQDHAGAQFNLGMCYANGRGVPRDDAEATRWNRRAADQGHADAQFNLGLTYAQGNQVAQSFDEARHWLYLAADQGHAKALACVDHLPPPTKPGPVQSEGDSESEEWETDSESDEWQDCES